MLKARRTQSRAPLTREISASQKIRTLQDPGATSSVTSGLSSSGSSVKVNIKTLIGDPHEDAQAVGREFSGKLAKFATVPSTSHDSNIGSQRLSKRRGESKSLRIDKLQKPTAFKKMTSEKDYGEGEGRDLSDSAMEYRNVDVRDRIRRIESAFERSSTTVSGELRKGELLKQLKERGRRHANRVSEDLPKSSNKHERKSAQREELTRKVNSLSQLLGKHLEGSDRSALNMLAMVQDVERSNNFGVESFSESDEEELNSTEMELSRTHESSSLHRAILSRCEEQPKRKSHSHHGCEKPARMRAKERGDSIERPLSKNSSARLREMPVNMTIDDNIAASDLPEQDGCGNWDWSRIHKLDGKTFLYLTGLAYTDLESKPLQGVDVKDLLTEQHPPVQSISSLDSDANALPLLIGEDGHDSDPGGYYVETGTPNEAPQNLKGRGKRKASPQNADKDVPVMETGSTSHLEMTRTFNQKYRPKKFNEIVGQNVVVKSLSTAVAKRKAAPVYMFMGPRGTGKTSAARVFAAGLNCLSLDYARRPCGLCRECGTIALNRSADVRQIDAASNMDMASMRAMMGSFTPHAQYKVFIVEGCDLLSSDIWNAFLKVLEEPPRNVVFILITTHPERIPPTAISRCQKFQFFKLKEADIVNRLQLLAAKENLRVEVDALALIATRSDGSLRDAEIVLDQLCLLDKNVSIAAVRELVGLPPDNKTMDLLDYALSADTVRTVRTIREVLISGVEPATLVSELGSLITDILAGSVDAHRGARKEGFFNRSFSVQEEHHGLRQALKILWESEKQLRVSTDPATWLTAALLQFAPDRSLPPSDFNMSVAPSRAVTATSADVSVLREQHSLVDELDQAYSPEHTSQGRALQVYVESRKDPTLELETATSFSEQKLEEAWATVQLTSLGRVEELTEVRPPPEAFLEFGGKELDDLWKQAIRKIPNRSLRHLLQIHGQLVAAGVSVDRSIAVVELDFDHGRNKHKAERSWRSICIAFQELLNSAVELRIALREIVPEDPDFPRIGEMMVDTESGPSTQLKDKEIVNESANADVSLKNEQKMPPRSRRRPHYRTRKYRCASEIMEAELGAAEDSSESNDIPRRIPPRWRSRVKRLGAAKHAKQVCLDIGIDYQQSSSSFEDEVRDSRRGSIESKSSEKKPLSCMMEEPQSEIEDLKMARQKILRQQVAQYRNNPALMATLDHKNGLISGFQRGFPSESSLCWEKETSQSDFLMRKTGLRSMHKAAGAALFFKMVPCRDSRIGRNATPTSTAPVSVA